MTCLSYLVCRFRISNILGLGRIVAGYARYSPNKLIFTWPFLISASAYFHSTHSPSTLIFSKHIWGRVLVKPKTNDSLFAYYHSVHSPIVHIFINFCLLMRIISFRSVF
jgi:hypothetical protein